MNTFHDILIAHPTSLPSRHILQLILFSYAFFYNYLMFTSIVFAFLFNFLRLHYSYLHNLQCFLFQLQFIVYNTLLNNLVLFQIFYFTLFQNYSKFHYNVFFFLKRSDVEAKGI